MSLQDLPLDRKIKAFCGIMGTVLAVMCLFLILLLRNGYSGVPTGLIVVTVICGVGGPYLWWAGLKGKDRISSYQYEQFKEIKVFTALNEKRNDYEKELVNSPDLFKYKELSKKFPSLYYGYATSVLEMPMQYTKPVSATTAAYVGTAIGGAAVGMVAANQAEKDRIAYEKNVRDVIESKLAVGSARDKVRYCYDEMIKIIKTNDKTKKDWEYTESIIDSELHQQYKVR